MEKNTFEDDLECSADNLTALDGDLNRDEDIEKELNEDEKDDNDLIKQQEEDMLGHPKLSDEEIEFLIQQNAVYNTEYKKLSTGELYSFRKTGVPNRKINAILLHGNLVSSINMESIMYKLELKGKFIAPCLRGYGFSSLNNPVKSFDDLADDVYAFMEETFPEIEDYYVLGHDTGAIVGLKLALKHPEKVKGLTLLSPIPVTGLKDEIPVNSIEDLKKFKQKSFLYGMIQNRDKQKYKTMLDYYHIEGEEERDV